MLLMFILGEAKHSVLHCISSRSLASSPFELVVVEGHRQHKIGHNSHLCGGKKSVPCLHEQLVNYQDRR